MTRFQCWLGAITMGWALAACFTGPSAAGYAPANSGHGAEGRVQLDRRRVVGELLEVRDSAFVVLNDEGVLLLPFSVVEEASFEGAGTYSGGAPGAEMAKRLRLVSRFPHGISSGVLEMLLAEARQSELRVVRQ